MDGAVVMEYCVGYKYKLNNYYQNMNEVDSWYDAIYNKSERYLVDNEEWIKQEEENMRDFIDEIPHDRLQNFGVFALKIKLLLQQL